MKVRNLTPHPVNLGGATIPPEGIVPRVGMSTESLGSLQVQGVEVPVVRTRATGVEGLPAAEPGVFLLVSRVVADAARDRADLLVPDGLVRDDKGRVTGATRLASLSTGEVAL